MKHYYFYQDFNDESVQKLFEYADKMDDNLTIYLNSNGGYIGSTAAFLSFVNNNKDKIKLIACGNVDSCAFIAFFKSQCRRIICEEARGMFHLLRMSIETNSQGNPTCAHEKDSFAFIKSYDEYMQKFMNEIGLSEEQIAKANNGEDIFFTNIELQEILDRQTNKNTLKVTD